MEHIAPLIQTILWVTLIAGIVWRFHIPIYGLLTALQKRIEAGSNIKAGPFELSEHIRTQDLAEQVERTETEVTQLMQAQAEDEPNRPVPPAAIKSRFLEAEDLALRAIQVEYGKPISRQVSLGPALAVDGVFTVNGQLNVVEAKLFSKSRRAVPIIRETLEAFQNVLRTYYWKNVRVILAIVLHETSDVEDTRRQLLALADEFDFPIDVRCYGLDDLKSEFGLD